MVPHRDQLAVPAFDLEVQTMQRGIATERDTREPRLQYIVDHISLCTAAKENSTDDVRVAQEIHRRRVAQPGRVDEDLLMAL